MTRKVLIIPKKSFHYLDSLPYFFLDEKVSKKSRQNYAVTRSNAIQKLLQKLASPFCVILSLALFTLCLLAALPAQRTKEQKHNLITYPVFECSKIIHCIFFAIAHQNCLTTLNAYSLLKYRYEWQGLFERPLDLQ